MELEAWEELKGVKGTGKLWNYLLIFEILPLKAKIFLLIHLRDLRDSFNLKTKTNYILKPPIFPIDIGKKGEGRDVAQLEDYLPGTHEAPSLILSTT